MKSHFLLLIFLVGTSSLNISCNASKKTKGAIIGAAVGAVSGALLTKKNKAVGIIIGASVGGVAGALIGRYMDKQAAEIERNLEGARVERIGEGIVVTFESGLMFDFDSYSLKAKTKENLDQLAITIKKYEDTDVVVYGHTDNTGDQAYNQSLSENRASAVESFLTSKEVPARRLDTEGHGELDPVSTNETETGRQQNRRVEITIVANKKLIRDAKKGDVPGI